MAAGARSPRRAEPLLRAARSSPTSQAYSWEINQREKVESKGAVDLKAWTRDEIVAEARAAYLEVWAEREALGRRARRRRSPSTSSRTTTRPGSAARCATP